MEKKTDILSETTIMDQSLYTQKWATSSGTEAWEPFQSPWWKKQEVILVSVLLVICRMPVWEDSVNMWKEAECDPLLSF